MSCSPEYANELFTELLAQLLTIHTELSDSPEIQALLCPHCIVDAEIKAFLSQAINLTLSFSANDPKQLEIINDVKDYLNEQFEIKLKHIKTLQH